MQLARLNLTFDEPVDMSSVTVSELTIHNNVSGGESFTLKASTLSTNIDDELVSIEIHIEDFQKIKALFALATAENDTFVRIGEHFVIDTRVPEAVANALREEAAFPVATFIMDSQGPELFEFTAFDLDSGTVTPIVYRTS